SAAPPRAWLGDAWATGVVELFDSIVRRVPPLLPTVLAEDPLACLSAGTVPTLRELRLHNGTVWRWNRPVYEVQDGRPHLRIENRVLPSGPTPLDMVANAAFYFGLIRALADADRPLWSVVPFPVTGRNLHAAARLGLDAVLQWMASTSRLRAWSGTCSSRSPRTASTPGAPRRSSATATCRWWRSGCAPGRRVRAGRR